MQRKFENKRFYWNRHGAPFQELHIKGGNLLLSSGDCNMAGSNGSIFFGKDISLDKPFGEWGIEYYEDEISGGLNFWRPASSTSQTLNFALFLDEAGNVALGTNSPKAKLHVEGDVFIGQGLIVGDGSKDMRLDVNGFITATSLRSGGGKKMIITDEDGLLQIDEIPLGDNLGDHKAIKNLTLGNNSISNSGMFNSLFIDTDENVNISNSIVVAGKVYGKFVQGADAFGKLELIGSTLTDAARIEVWQGGSTNSRSIKFSVYESSANFQFFHGENGNLTQKFVINKENIVVGLPSANMAFNVNGIVTAKEVKVSLDEFWPDYVFKAEYLLPSLLQVESFIKDNGHLPGIPNAATVEKEGINLGEMNALLLQKIEELTLYMIAQEKEIKELKTLVNTIK
ncbi:MAG: hypothetical protein FD170_2388 [Bacteroidetes bacterium]|nr:MAG: hypothetical protein FD170_2388 [Bacteroidota bacterium]